MAARDPSVLSGRNLALIGVFLVLNVVVIVVVVLLNGRGEDDKGSGAATTQSDAAKRGVPLAGRVVAKPVIGARIRSPRGWKVGGGDRTIVLRSPDSTTIMSISEPPAGGNSDDLVRSAVGVIRKRYRAVTVRPLRGMVAGLPTVSRVLTATNERGVRLNVLVSSPRGRSRAWLVQVFSGPGARERRLPEAQVALGTLRLRG